MSGAKAPPMLRKDQGRALDAYRWAEGAKKVGHLKEFEIAVQSFAASLLRSGLAVAAAVLERDRKRPAVERLLGNLASHMVPGIDSRQVTGTSWPASVRAIADTSHYMLATREYIALTTWLRRACRALGEEPEPSDEAGAAP